VHVVSVFVGRSRRSLVLYGGALILALIIGAAIAYAQSFLGDRGPYLVVGALLVVVVAVAILLEWRLGAIMVVAALPFEVVIKGILGSGMKALALLTIFSLMLALLRDHRLLERFLRLWQQPLTLAVAFFVLWAMVSISWALVQGAALIEVIAFLGGLGLLTVIGMLEERYLTLSWTFAGLSAALSVPLGYMLPQSGKMVTEGRFGTGGADPNSYACLLVIVFFVVFFGLRQHTRVTFILAPVLFFGIFATQSRTGLVALVATPLLALFVPGWANRLGLRTLLITLLMYFLGAAALAGIILAVPEIGDSVWQRYATLSDFQSDATWSGRWSIWQAALQIIASHPILGVGTGNFHYFAIHLSEYIASRAAEDAAGNPSVAHNMFLSVASELGIIGLVLFSGALFFAFRAVHALSLRFTLATGIFLGLIAFTIAGMTLTWEAEKLGYVLLGSILSLKLQQPGQH
jgi:O-antigen ligase